MVAIISHADSMEPFQRVKDGVTDLEARLPLKQKVRTIHLAIPLRRPRTRVGLKSLPSIVPHSSRERPGAVKKMTRTAGASNPQVIYEGTGRCQRFIRASPPGVVGQDWRSGRCISEGSVGPVIYSGEIP
jgi:hypothetical protein